MGHLLAGIVGDGSYYLGDAPTLSMADSNTLTISGGADLLLQGRHVRLTGTDSLTITSGAQSSYRHDIVYARYSYDATTAVESVSLIVVEGAASTASTGAEDPSTDYSDASILDGDATVDVALARVSLSGLTPTAEWLLEGVSVADPLKMYPVGSVYMSYESTSPASLFGGTWTAITGRFPYFNAGTGTGGSNTHSHTYGIVFGATYGTVSGNDNDAIYLLNAGNWDTNETSGFTIGDSYNANTAQAFSSGSVYHSVHAATVSTGNTMPAYQSLYAWRRTA